ncbi:enoyl-CoA hydratase EchA1 [Mycobacterium xenopi 3993]|nr:enoyl-CoA hydratase EchA1 [Mycobacterium xenopi 3993]
MSEQANTQPVVLTEQRERILIITINRPEAKNAVNAAVSQGLADAMDRLDGDTGLSVAILTGRVARSARAWISRRLPGVKTSSSRVAVWLHRTSTRQAGDRRGRGLCAGRWHRAGPGM